MNEQSVLIGIGVVVAAFILRPLLRRPSPVAPPRATPVAPAAAASEQLAELELDRSMGRVSDEDYARWRGELETTAPPATIEPEPKPNDSVSKAEELVRRWRESPRPTCPNCGERPEPGARFCSNCGASLPNGVRPF